MRTLVLISVLLLGALPISAEDTSHGPIPAFASCPDTLTANCGDTITYQFQIINAKSGQPHPDARYFIAKGYGQIDSLTGLYTYPDRGLVNHVRPAKVGGYFVTSKRPDTIYCSFTLQSCFRQSPHINGDCPITAPSFRRGTYTELQLEADTYCGNPVWSVIPPSVSGIHAQISPTGLLYLSGIVLGDNTATVILSDPCGADTCEVNFTITDEYPYDVRIEKKRMVLQGGYENVRVTIDSVLPDHGLGGFDLLITFDQTAISLQSVTEGDIYAKCGWEYFTYRYGADSNCPTCPPGLVRVIGIAETNNGDDHPNCGYPDSLPATLFTMKFLVSNDRSLDCIYSPIRFFWRDCEDNRLMCDSGYCNYFMAGRVFDSLNAPYPIDSIAGVFPGTNGLPYDSCHYIENLRPSPQRYVDFYHGGLEIVCADSITESCWGDLDGDGIAFETSDYTRFCLLLVTPAFLPEILSCTDIDRDSVYPTVADFVLFYRNTMQMEINPPSPLDTVEFLFRNDTLILSSNDTLGALLLKVEGRVGPSPFVPNMPGLIHFDGVNTNILIRPSSWYPGDEPIYRGIRQGGILTGLEGHEILSIQTATYRGGKLFAQVLPHDVSRYAIRISKAHNVLQGTFSDIDVILERADPAMGLGGFNLLLTYNPQHLSPTEVIRGSIFDSCAWEYFTYRHGADGNCSAGCPTGLVRVIGLADMNNGDTHPVADCAIDGLTLFSLKFLVSSEGNLNCAFLPVRPFWIDCGDNTLADETGQILLLASNVYRYCDTLPYLPEDATFPGIAGVPAGACPGYSGHEPLHWVDFYPGGVDVACADTVDGRGDIDINGQPFETADELLFARYLVYGDSVLTVSKRGQLVTTDINSDGELGTIEDLVLLHRRVQGLEIGCLADDLASVGMPPGRAAFSVSNNTLFVETQDTLGAVLISIMGNIWPRDPVAGMTARYYFDGAVTRILIAPDIEDPAPDAYILSGPVFYGINLGQILSIKAASHRGAQIITSFTGMTQPPYALALGRKTVSTPPNVTLSVTLERQSMIEGIGGFDILITYNDTALSLLDVIPGSLDALCDWEYFTYRVNPNIECTNRCQGGLVRVFGIAETNNGTPHARPDCDATGQRLFDLSFSVSNSRLYECATLPIYFYWSDCGDNVIYSRSGNIRFAAQRVYDIGYPYLDTLPIPFDSATFPGVAGLPQGACSGTPGLWPGVDFFHGYLNIPCGPELDPIGDINLNDLAYEIADERLFAAYFINGLSAFTINQLGQTAASDINRDSTTLTVEDYVMLHRIINGWALPYDNPPDDPDTVHFLHAFGPLYAATDDTLGAVALVVEGNITPRSILPNMVMEYAFDGTNTHIFIHPPHGSTDSTAYILVGPVVDLQSANPILSISVSTHRGAHIPCTLEDYPTDADDNDPNLPGSFALHQNYPNPFNAGTVVSFDLPRSSEVKLEIINVLGNVVYRRAGAYSAGTHKIDWNGTTTGGQPVASGIYYYRLTAGGKVASRKMLLLK